MYQKHQRFSRNVYYSFCSFFVSILRMIRLIHIFTYSQNDTTRSEILKLVENREEDKLRAVLLRGRLQFGTAGLRGPMKAGYVCMNDLVILQTAQVRTYVF